jgi:pyruvate dehydrogenase E2 component (dihydrolipoamide acetyltransferase)
VGELSKSGSQETNFYEIEHNDISNNKLKNTKYSHDSLENDAHNFVNEPICLNAFKESKTRKSKTNDSRKSQSSLASVSPRTMAFAKTLGLEELFEHTYYGEMTLQDLLTIYKEKHKATVQSQAQAQQEQVPLKGVRKVMAQAMTQSHKEIPAATLFEDADISHWPLQADITLAVIKGISTACKLVPIMNASYDAKNMTVEMHKDVNLGIAVNSDHGLYVPVIRQAHLKKKSELRQEITLLREQINTKKITPKELQGATISLSNFGVLSGRYATPIIVPPQVCIIGIGKKREAPIVKNAKISVGTILPISISFDHRVATGAEAAEFMQNLIDVLKNEY